MLRSQKPAGPCAAAAGAGARGAAGPELLNRKPRNPEALGPCCAVKSRPGPAQPPPVPARAGRLVHAIYLVQAAALLYVIFLAVLIKWLRPGVMGMGLSLVRSPDPERNHHQQPGARTSSGVCAFHVRL